MAVNSRLGKDLKPYSLEHIANQSFDQDFQLLVNEIVGYNPNTQAIERVSVINGKLQSDTTIDTTGLATSAKQDAGNASLSSIDGKIPASPATTGKQDTGNTSVASIDTKLTDVATQTTLALIKAKTDNIDVALSTRTKPGDTQKVDGSAVVQPVSASSLPLPVGAATETTLGTRLSESDFDAKIGSLTETAPASDVASSGLNGRLQRIAQRLSSLITALGSPFQAGGSIGNTSFTATQATGSNLHVVVDTAPTTAVTGPLTDTQLRATAVPISGTVSEARTDTSPASQNITAQDTNSTTTAGQNSQSIITGTPTANATALFTLSGQNTINVQITGVWTGTLASEISFDGGTTWYTRGLHQLGTNYNIGSFTSNGQGVSEISGGTNYRVRATAAVTGTAVIKITESLNPASFYLINTPQLADGTIPTQKLSISAGGAAKVDGSAVTQPVSGSFFQATQPISATTLPQATLPATGVNNQKTVATAGSRVQLQSNALTVGVIIQALSTNTGLIYVGDATVSASNGFELQPGQATSAGVSNTNAIYIDASVSGDKICYIGS